MAPRKKRRNKHRELVETVTDALNLIQSLQKEMDYNVVNQLGWNLGWHNNIYITEILEDNYNDWQALAFAEKILQQILDTEEEQQ